MSIDIDNLVKEIKKLEYMLERANSTSMKLRISDSLDYLYNLYEELTFCEYEGIEQPLSLYIAEEKYYGKKFDGMLEHLNDMRLYHRLTSKNILKIYKDAKFQSFSQNKIRFFKEDEAFDILYDFFNKYNPDYYRLVKRMIENNQISIQPLGDNRAGLCYKVCKLEKSYILYDIEGYDISGLRVLAHEFGHAIHNELLYNKNPQQSINYYYTNYLEVPSLYFERLFLDYSFKNKLSDYDTLFVFNNIYAEILHNFTAIRFFTHPKMNNIEFTRDYKIDSNLKFDIIKSMDPELLPIKNRVIDFNVREKFIYGYGMLVAMYFIEQYKHDPKQTQKNFNDFMNKMGLVDCYDILNTCGLNAEEISNPKVLKKELKNHVTKIKKELKINY